MASENFDEFVESDFECLKIYFDEDDWIELSVYERERFATIKRNYENLVAIGKITNIFCLIYISFSIFLHKCFYEHCDILNIFNE